MNKKKIILIFFTSIFLVSCSQNKIIDFDISDLPKRKKITVEKENKELVDVDNTKFIKDLDIFESKEKVLTKFKIGKKDPFSKSETQVNQFSSDFKLTGFLNTKKDNYVFVSYQGNKGTISEDSIGGSNTYLLPNGAKVIKIDSKKSQLKINFDNEVYIFEL
mgnify:FL=1